MAEQRKQAVQTAYSFKTDPVGNSEINHPPHYGGNIIYETIKVIEAKLTHEQFIGYLRGQQLKYLIRAGLKEGEPVEKDLQKGLWHVQYELDYRARHAKGLVQESFGKMTALGEV